MTDYTEYQIYLYDSLNQEKEAFFPLDLKEKVRMYVCGPTVYDRAHIGNARTVVVFDMLYRLLREIYGKNKVFYARNYTDVDDKIINHSRETNEPIETITKRTIRWYEKDMKAIGALQPNKKPCATKYIEKMEYMITELIDKGFAYEAAGHVLFSVQDYAYYGALSKRTLEGMRAGERVEVANYKRDPMDFVLWKPSKADEPSWPSPWGRGRPGWHIECSAMARDLLGDTFDIHGGGSDLQFPHHENEIAQSCACSGESKMANVWMHNEMLQVDGKKMSKSLGNFLTVHDLLKQGYKGSVIRTIYLMTHYRKPMDWSDTKTEEAERRLGKWLHPLKDNTPEASKIYHPILEAICDDLNTPLALRYMDELAGQAYDNQEARAQLVASLEFLGLLEKKQEELNKKGQRFVDIMIYYRQVAREEKNFEMTDWIRDQLKKVGVMLEDNKNNSGIRLTSDFTKRKLTTFKTDIKRKRHDRNEPLIQEIRHILLEDKLLNREEKPFIPPRYRNG